MSDSSSRHHFGAEALRGLAGLLQAFVHVDPYRLQFPLQDLHGLVLLVAEIELERDLALRIGSAEAIDAIDDKHWIECGQHQMGLSRRYTQRALDELRGRLLEVLRPTADRLLEKEPAAEPAIGTVRRVMERRYR